MCRRRAPWQLNRRAAFAKFGLGYAAVKAGDIPYGQWWYRQVLTEHAASQVAPEARYRLGWSLTWHNPTEAIVHLQQVVATDTTDRRLADALRALGIAYGHPHLRDWDAARAAYEELLARSGDDYRYRHAGAHNGLGLIYYYQQQYDLARVHLETVIARWPTREVADRARRTLAKVVRDQAAAAEGGQ